jgi:type IV secretory pathway TrbD component
VTLGLLLVALIVAHGANARIARLITEDDITEPWRAGLRRKYGTANLLVRWAHCPWCAGWWTSALIVTPVAWFPIMGLRYWWIFGLAVWSVAHAAGRLNHHHGSTGG